MAGHVFYFSENFHTKALKAITTTPIINSKRVGVKSPVTGTGIGLAEGDAVLVGVGVGVGVTVGKTVAIAVAVGVGVLPEPEAVNAGTSPA